MATPKLTGPVGESPRKSPGKPVKNASADVKLVQELLTAAGFKAPPSGRVDAKTIDAINKFQKAKSGLRVPDGVVDPDGKTFKALLKLGAKALEKAEEPEKKDEPPRAARRRPGRG